MCQNPIILRRKKLDGSFREITVPCGKCAECRSKKHSAFALEAVLEARAASSMYFVTLTYNNDKVPIMGRRVFFDKNTTQSQECWFESENTPHRASCMRLSKVDMDSNRSIIPFSYVERFGSTEEYWNEVYYTPSLNREQVRLWLKKSRIVYKRLYGQNLDFRYCFFGEYGSETHRPHYHGLLLNLSKEQADFLKDRWSKEFGFCDFRFIPAVNPDGSPARVKVANYVSKYMSKDYDYMAINMDLVERPRMFRSRGFGTAVLSESEVESLKNFTDAKI